MSNKAKLIVAVVVLVAVAAAGGAWWFLRDDAPEPVDQATARASVGEGDATFDGSVAGTWVVDTSIGTFDFESASGTFVGFRIDEELASIGSTEAVGRTGDVSGQVTIEGTAVTAASIDADLTTVTTNDARRDDRVQQALDTGGFPTATFTLVDEVELGDAAADGAPVSVTASGELTIHGVTRPVEVAIEAEVADGVLVVTGSTEVTFSDFGVEVPKAPIVVSASDTGTVELQLLLTKR